MIYLFLLSSVSGILFFLSSPEFSFFYLSWFSLIPFLYAVERSSPKLAYIQGCLFGFAAFYGGFPWIKDLFADFVGWKEPWLYFAVPL